MKTISFSSLTLAFAADIAQTALTIAARQGLAMVVTVIDARGEVLVYQRMDRAPAPARFFSERKAYTALEFKRPTAAWKERYDQVPHVMSCLEKNDQLTFIGGGAPILIDEQIVGAIGISGGTEQQDEQVLTETLSQLSLA